MGKKPAGELETWANKKKKSSSHAREDRTFTIHRTLSLSSSSVSQPMSAQHAAAAEGILGSAGVSPQKSDGRVPSSGIHWIARSLNAPGNGVQRGRRWTHKYGTNGVMIRLESADVPGRML